MFGKVKINDPYNTMGTPASKAARPFSSGLFRPGSDSARADSAAFEAAVSGAPGIDRNRVRRMAEAEAEAVSRHRAGNPDTRGTGLSEAWTGASGAEKDAFGRYLHTRPQPW